MTVYGYIRVSTSNKKQTTENQKKEIIDSGYAVTQFFSEDGVSGSIPQMERPSFLEMMSILKEGDTCVVSKIDRLGRDATDIMNTIDGFKQKGIKIAVLQFGGLDMGSTAGKFLKSILAAVAEMERDLVIERIHSGLARTKAQGTILGRPLKLEPELLAKLCYEREYNGKTFDTLSQMYKLPKSLICRNINEWKDKLEEYKEEFSKRKQQYALSKSLIGG